MTTIPANSFQASWGQINGNQYAMDIDELGTVEIMMTSQYSSQPVWVYQLELSTPDLALQYISNFPMAMYTEATMKDMGFTKIC